MLLGCCIYPPVTTDFFRISSLIHPPHQLTTIITAITIARHLQNPNLAQHHL
ncbi:hypothetical protein Hdeb2414_s0024g00648531 [Helianthus debilis subsp. tardiflorus]